MDIRIGEFTTDVLVAGAGDDVVLCHGSASDHRTWHGQIDFMASNNFRVITYSRRYHWPNSPPSQRDEYTMAQHVDDLAAVIRDVASGPVHLVGHSYGGFTALLAADRYPELVRSLVVSEPPVVPLFLSDPPKPAELLRVLVSRPRLGIALVKFGATGIVPATKAASKNEMEKAVGIFGKAVLGKEAFEQLSPERWAQVQANNIGAEYLSQSFDPLSSAEVKSLAVRTLIVAGERSPRIWPMLADYLDELMPNSQRVDIPEASHLMHEDNPDAFNQELLVFLKAGS